jgi:hypothetical protein
LLWPASVSHKSGMDGITGIVQSTAEYHFIPQ